MSAIHDLVVGILEPLLFVALSLSALFVVAFLLDEHFRHTTVRAVIAWWHEVLYGQEEQ